MGIFKTQLNRGFNTTAKTNTDIL